jgi:hypothetical protein
MQTYAFAMRVYVLATLVLAASCGSKPPAEPAAPEAPAPAPAESDPPQPPDPAPAPEGEPPAGSGPQCGGIAGLTCPSGQECVDDPNDDCDPAQGGRDCGGVCRAK